MMYMSLKRVLLVKVILLRHVPVKILATAQRITSKHNIIS